MSDIDRSRKRDRVCAINNLGTLLLALSVYLPGLCCGQTYGSWNGFSYSVGGNAISITSFDISQYGPPGGVVNIPSSIAGLNGSVTSIGPNAFYYCSGMTSVTIPNSVTSIGDGAFNGCSGLTNVTIGNSVTSIGNGVFNSCSSLTSVTIPASVTSIGYEAFSYCSTLNVIAVASGNAFYSSLNGVLFDKSQSLLIQFPGGLTGAYIIPTRVTSVGNGTFQWCSGLTGVTIPSSVTNVGDYAFSYCSGLTNITIPTSVTSIGDGAFDYCTGLTSVTIPSGITSIGRLVFLGCSNLASVTIPNGVTSIGEMAFALCASLTNINIPSSVTSIGDNAFDHCSALTRITVPNSVTNIGGSAFQVCPDLTSVTIPNSVISIGDYAFAWCSNLTSAYFQGSAPLLFGPAVFYETTSAFTIYYPSCAAGWSTPIWMDYPAYPYSFLVAGIAAYNRSPNTPLIVRISDLLTNVACCGSVSLVGIGTDGYNLLSTNGVTLLTNANFIFYTNSVTPNANDSFQYMVEDSQGDTKMGTVFVTVSSGNLPGPPINAVVSATSVTLNVLGVPNYSYSVERSLDLAHWVSISANIVAPGSGLMQVVDTFDDLGKEPQFAFYRVEFTP